MEDNNVEADVVSVDENETTSSETLSVKETSRLDIRRGYRKLIREVQEKREDLVKPDCYDLLTHVKTANSLFHQVTSKTDHRQVSYTKEALLDSRFMALSVAIADEKINLLPTDFVQFRPQEFLEKLAAIVGVRGIDDDDNAVQINAVAWKTLGVYVRRFLKPATPVLSVISGTFDTSLQPKRGKKTTKQSPKREAVVNNALVVQPVDVTQSQKEEATTAEIEQVLAIIRNIHENDPRPIDYFELVVNPQSFGLTVENIFHVSFLAKDDLIRIFMDKNGIPVVEPIDVNEPKPKDIDKNSRCQQFAVSLSIEEWEDIVEVYELAGRTPFIKLAKRLDESTTGS